MKQIISIIGTCCLWELVMAGFWVSIVIISAKKYLIFPFSLTVSENREKPIWYARRKRSFKYSASYVDIIIRNKKLR